MTKSRLFDIILVGVTAVLITVTALIYPKDVFLIIPLYISLFVMIMQSHVNRYCFLLGGLNSIIYACVYLYTGLYATAAYALLFSFTMQMFTFFRWNKRAYGKATVLTKLSFKQRLIFGSLLGMGVAVFCLILSHMQSGYALFDSLISLLGICSSLLCAFSFIEYVYISLICGFVSVALYAVMLKDNPIQITYFIYSVYSIVCTVRSAVNLQRLYSLQHKA